MSIPGLALFYGGLVRSKNMLSVLMQVFVIFSLISVLWAIYGYSIAFTEGNAFFGSLDKLFLKGVTVDSVAATFSKGVVIPEYVYIAFQLTFAGLTSALIIGGFAERIKFSAVLAFVVVWFTFSYLPLAHVVERVLVEQVARAGSGAPVAVEATYGWYWAVDALTEAGFEVTLAHPRGVASMQGRRAKTDKLDATGREYLDRVRAAALNRLVAAALNIWPLGSIGIYFANGG